MRAAVFHGPGNIAVDIVPDPRIEEPTDAIIAVEAAGVCGSDLWTYRGESKVAPGARIGHEFVGRVVEAGRDVRNVSAGDWVIVPFRYSCGECVYCRRGLSGSCLRGGFWSREVLDAGQGEMVRVPFADGTLVRPLGPGEAPDVGLVPSLLALTDVMVTGLHAARCARVAPGATVCVVGDGAVAVSAVLAARLLGAERIIVLGSSHSARQELMREVGGDVVLNARGDAAVAKARDLTEGLGADAVMECVGSGQSFATALAIASDGATVGYVGLPHGITLDPATMFARNLGLAGGMAPARSLIPMLLPHVMDGSLNPGVVFDSRYPLAGVPAAYDDLDNRCCVKPFIDLAPRG